MEQKNVAVWLFTMCFNLAAFVDRGTITFFLGVIVSLLAIIHYILSIQEKRRNLKK